MNNTSQEDNKEIQLEKRYLQTIIIIITMLILSALIMAITFAFSKAIADLNVLKTYFQDIVLLTMNFIPIFLLMIFVYLISNRLWISFSVTSLLFVTMSIVNKFKLSYRDDPFSFIDIKLIGESLMMANKYKIRLSSKMIIMIIFLIGIAIILSKFFKYKIDSKKTRIISLFILTITSIVIFKGFYFNSETYAEVGDKSTINVWIESQQFQSKGFVYPFIYSIPNSIDKKPESYNDKKAKEELYKNIYKDIPEGEKVNLITIMLESFNDFSEFEGIDVDKNVYKNFHQLRDESIQGKLITNVFGGGTIDTERGFLTGFSHQPKYNRKTNSIVWYLKEQGYRTEGMHPITGSFYNRRNANEYLGFDDYYYYENKYKDEYKNVGEGYLSDKDFFYSIIKEYENNKKNNQPYFNYSLTYQNHGPYSEEKYTEEEYLKKKDSYDYGTYNAINNYLSGINKTDKALKEIFDYFRNEDEPTVIVIFGDHNPWLGKDNSGYDMMNINWDLSTEEGFVNYYQTPYLIWGNDGAKKTFNKDFVGEGSTISPNFLMAELFQYLGWEGNEHMQHIIKLKDKIDVTNKLYYKENGEYTKELSEENKQLLTNYLNLEYYHSQNFKK